jgi:acyl dehydratase
LNQIEYNKQAVDWKTLQEGEVVATFVYGVPHTDATHYAEKAIQDVDPWYMEESPFGGPIVPPGYFYGEYIRLLVAPNYPMGMLNAKLSFESKGPIFHGEQVTVIGTIDSIYTKRDRPYLDLGVIIKKANGQTVSRGVVTLLLELEAK